MKLIWSERYSVKVAEIDEQHKNLFAFINRVDEAIKNNGPIEVVEQIIKEMNDYAEYHFSTEEKYFDKFDYPEADEHKKQHDSYEGKMKYFNENFKNLEKEELTDYLYELLDFLEDWWTGHILHEDMHYSKFFNEHGLK